MSKQYLYEKTKVIRYRDGSEYFEQDVTKITAKIHVWIAAGRKATQIHRVARNTPLDPYPFRPSAEGRFYLFSNFPVR